MREDSMAEILLSLRYRQQSQIHHYIILQYATNWSVTMAVYYVFAPRDWTEASPLKRNMLPYYFELLQELRLDDCIYDERMVSNDHLLWDEPVTTMRLASSETDYGSPGWFTTLSELPKRVFVVFHFRRRKQQSSLFSKIWRRGIGDAKTSYIFSHNYWCVRMDRPSANLQAHYNLSEKLARCSEIIKTRQRYESYLLSDICSRSSRNATDSDTFRNSAQLQALGMVTGCQPRTPSTCMTLA